MRRFFHITLIVSGLGFLLLGLALEATITATPAHAQEQVRPTLTPLPPTTPPSPTRTRREEPTVTPEPTGRITGTVINLTTGAPEPGALVTIGDRAVVTDANGNYDRNGLAPGRYAVALALSPSQGVAEQPVMVDLVGDATVIQHLSFNQPQVIHMTAAPSAAVPSATPVVPAQLPSTGAPVQGTVELFVTGAVLILAGTSMRLTKRR